MCINFGKKGTVSKEDSLNEIEECASERKVEEALPYTNKELWDFYNSLKEKSNSNNDIGKPVLYYIYKGENDSNAIGVSVALDFYYKGDNAPFSRHFSDEFSYSKSYYYIDGDENYGSAYCRNVYDNFIGNNPNYELVSEEEFNEYIAKKREEYREAFRNSDIQQIWYYIGTIKEVSDVMGVYAIRINGKFIDDYGKCWVAYSISDMIYSPNYWKPMENKEWNTFSRMYSTEKPEYFELNR